MQAENARVAALHAQEVKEKLAREEGHRLAVVRWEASRQAAWAQHERDVAAAKVAHTENVQRLMREWELHKQDVENMNAVRLSEAEALHARLVEEVTALNKRLRAEHAEKLKGRKVGWGVWCLSFFKAGRICPPHFHMHTYSCAQRTWAQPMRRPPCMHGQPLCEVQRVPILTRCAACMM